MTFNRLKHLISYTKNVSFNCAISFILSCKI